MLAPKVPDSILIDSDLDRCILLGFRGSHAHGMYLPPEHDAGTDDIDLMGVCVPGIDHYLGLRQYASKGTKEIKRGEWDVVVYEARKFISLLAQGNPNVLSLLWLDPQLMVEDTRAGQLLVINRDAFVGKHVYNAFTGYAYAQFEHMRSGTLMQHMGAKRKALREKFGYDPKHAAHLIRLLRMGTEFLATGTLAVMRPDAQELLEIKQGLWTFDRISIEADRLFRQIEAARDASRLPDRPDMDRINDLCVDVVETALYDFD